MKQQLFILSSIVIFGILLPSCKSYNYNNYEEAYNKNGIVILKLKNLKTDTSHLGEVKKATLPSLLGVDENDGKPIPDKNTAIGLINLYQQPLANADKTSRYVDFYFKNIYDYLTVIITAQADAEELKKYGLRLYFSKTLQGTTLSNSIILGPIYNTGRRDAAGHQIIEPLWLSQPNTYKAFDFGSLCPDNCTNNGDLTGFKWPM